MVSGTLKRSQRRFKGLMRGSRGPQVRFEGPQGDSRSLRGVSGGLKDIPVGLSFMLHSVTGSSRGVL